MVYTYEIEKMEIQVKYMFLYWHVLACYQFYLHQQILGNPELILYAFVLKYNLICINMLAVKLMCKS